MNPIRRRPCADPEQKQVPGEWITQKGIDSSRPVTEASCAKVEVTTDTPVHPAFPHAMVLTVSFALSPVTGLVCHRRQRSDLRQLDASVGASGPHGFAVRLKRRSSCEAKASTASRLNVRDDREAPLL